MTEAPRPASLSALYLQDLLACPGFYALAAPHALAATDGMDVAFVPDDEDDAHALDVHRALGGEELSVSIFTFEAAAGASPPAGSSRP